MVMLSRRPLEHLELCVSTLRIFATRRLSWSKQAEEAVRASENGGPCSITRPLDRPGECYGAARP